MLCIICEYANQRKVLTLRIFSIGLCVWADCSIVRLACDMSKVLQGTGVEEQVVLPRADEVDVGGGPATSHCSGIKLE